MVRGNISSFDESPDFFSKVCEDHVEKNSRENFKNLIRDSFSFIVRYFYFLPSIDQDIARLYYLDGMSQDQISKLLEISQAAVSRRLKYIIYRIKFLLRMPDLNPIQVRGDLDQLFPKELFEFAYFFYWELAQNRVKYFIETSQSGAANKFKKINYHLSYVICESYIRWFFSLGGFFNQLSDINILDINQRYLALVYKDYFDEIKKRDNVISFLCKKNDKIRTNSLVIGDSILKEE